MDNASNSHEKLPLVILAGPTAVGKSALSISLAKRIGGEIISADSMQVYRGMDIGSAKIRPEETEGIRHYLIDVLEPDEPFHVVRFQQLAKEAVQEIAGRGKIPILTGGTGFYIQALLYDIDFRAEEDADVSAQEAAEERPYRRSLEELARREGAAYLHRMLAGVDSEAAAQIHVNNTKRVIRALEYYHDTGERISEHNRRERQKASPYRYVYFVLNDRREAIYERINDRVDQMIRDGLVEEVRALRRKGYTRDMVSMQGLGYKEMLDYLNGACTLEEAVYRIKRDSRHFAKRQLTWFKREKNVIWINRSSRVSDEALLDDMVRYLHEAGIGI